MRSKAREYVLKTFSYAAFHLPRNGTTAHLPRGRALAQQWTFLYHDVRREGASRRVFSRHAQVVHTCKAQDTSTCPLNPNPTSANSAEHNPAVDSHVLLTTEGTDWRVAPRCAPAFSFDRGRKRVSVHGLKLRVPVALPALSRMDARRVCDACCPRGQTKLHKSRRLGLRKVEGLWRRSCSEPVNFVGFGGETCLGCCGRLGRDMFGIRKGCVGWVVVGRG